MNQPKKQESKEKIIKNPVVLPKNPFKTTFSKFGNKQSTQEVENYSREIHSKKNKVFRGVR